MGRLHITNNYYMQQEAIFSLPFFTYFRRCDWVLTIQLGTEPTNCETPQKGVERENMRLFTNGLQAAKQRKIII